MLDKLGTLGIVGIVVTVVGLAIVAWQNLLLAAGLAIMFAGVGLVAAGLVKNVLASFGLA